MCACACVLCACIAADLFGRQRSEVTFFQPNTPLYQCRPVCVETCRDNRFKLEHWFRNSSRVTPSLCIKKSERQLFFPRLKYSIFSTVLFFFYTYIYIKIYIYSWTYCLIFSVCTASNRIVYLLLQYLCVLFVLNISDISMCVCVCDGPDASTSCTVWRRRQNLQPAR